MYEYHPERALFQTNFILCIKIDYSRHQERQDWCVVQRTIVLITLIRAKFVILVCHNYSVLLTPWICTQYAVFPHAFPNFLQNVPQILSTYLNSKSHLGKTIHQNDMISFVFESAFHGLQFDMLEPYGR